MPNPINYKNYISKKSPTHHSYAPLEEFSYQQSERMAQREYKPYQPHVTNTAIYMRISYVVRFMLVFFSIGIISLLILLGAYMLSSPPVATFQPVVQTEQSETPEMIPSTTPTIFQTKTPQFYLTEEETIKGKVIVNAGDTTEVNVREGPGTQYNKVSILVPGQYVEIIGRSPDDAWWHVKVGGIVGWVYFPYLAVDNPLLVACDTPTGLCGSSTSPDKGNALNWDPAYVVEQNGVEVRLRAINFTASTTDIVACYDFPTQTESFWKLSQATIQIGEGHEENYRNYRYLSEIQNDHCVKLSFNIINLHGETPIIFRVREFIVPVLPTEVRSTEQINAANEKLSQYGIEIEPAAVEESDGPGGWKFVRRPLEFFSPEEDPRNIVMRILEVPVTGLWEFKVVLSNSNPK